MRFCMISSPEERDKSPTCKATGYFVIMLVNSLVPSEGERNIDVVILYSHFFNSVTTNKSKIAPTCLICQFVKNKIAKTNVGSQMTLSVA